VNLNSDTGGRSRWPRTSWAPRSARQTAGDLGMSIAITVGSGGTTALTSLRYGDTQMRSSRQRDRAPESLGDSVHPEQVDIGLGGGERRLMPPPRRSAPPAWAPPSATCWAATSHNAAPVMSSAARQHPPCAGLEGQRRGGTRPSTDPAQVTPSTVSGRGNVAQVTEPARRWRTPSQP
jgi:hypothetical protein